MIQLIDDSLAELKPKNEPPKPPPKAQSPPAEQKWSRENHPAFKKAAPAEEKEKELEAVTYQVNDTVMAKWLSGDKGFYPARITAVTGSSTAPIYTVKFKSYDTVETLRAKDIRPVAQKRKADGTAVSTNPSATASAATPSPSSLTPAPANNGIVLSAAADMYPQAQAANKAADNDDEKPRPKFKKIKATKELEKGKNKWQEFTTKGKFGKAAKKESMFRTPEGIHGRGEYLMTFFEKQFANAATVGFTGSGQTMRKDPTRTRHVYQPNEDLD
jgi:survival-of-motor-neuron-related-splicing factor 30